MLHKAPAQYKPQADPMRQSEATSFTREARGSGLVYDEDVTSF